MKMVACRGAMSFRPWLCWPQAPARRRQQASRLPRTDMGLHVMDPDGFPVQLMSKLCHTARRSISCTKRPRAPQGWVFTQFCSNRSSVSDAIQNMLPQSAREFRESYLRQRRLFSSNRRGARVLRTRKSHEGRPHRPEALGDLRQAEELARKAVALDPNNPPARSLLELVSKR